MMTVEYSGLGILALLNVSVLTVLMAVAYIGFRKSLFDLDHWEEQVANVQDEVQSLFLRMDIRPDSPYEEQWRLPNFIRSRIYLLAYVGGVRYRPQGFSSLLRFLQRERYFPLFAFHRRGRDLRAAGLVCCVAIIANLGISGGVIWEPVIFIENFRTIIYGTYWFFALMLLFLIVIAMTRFRLRNVHRTCTVMMSVIDNYLKEIYEDAVRVISQSSKSDAGS
jgi:hypothetical protein